MALGPPVSNPTHPSRLVVESVDVLIYASIAPLAYAFHRSYTRTLPKFGRIAMFLGIASGAGGIILSALFLTEMLQFGVGLWVNVASVAGLVLWAAWLVLGGFAAQSAGRLPHGTLMGIVGATVVGYPVWAIWLARRASHASPSRT